jgi:hypothetical protein
MKSEEKEFAMEDHPFHSPLLILIRFKFALHVAPFHILSAESIGLVYKAGKLNIAPRDVQCADGGVLSERARHFRIAAPFTLSDQNTKRRSFTPAGENGGLEESRSPPGHEVAAREK